MNYPIVPHLHELVDLMLATCLGVQSNINMLEDILFLNRYIIQ